MRLKAIKLAGFKSFVDPTTVTLPGCRSAVVGPNGCGKSNIVDAVRWVLGESSTRLLRGEASTDVIFNGSSARRPTAMAMVELKFDNADGRIGGEYAGFSEMAVRREVTRLGQSNYYLNGVKCRRRDIVDAFLGTGFGSRSYSIIEQGMIGELAQAKPEALRVYLEEAAGISRYKERRRETASSMQSTQDNLERLRDRRDELQARLSVLRRQADAAQRYRELKAEERHLKAESLALELKVAMAQASQWDTRLTQRETALEAAMSAVRHAEAALTDARGEHQDRIDAAHNLDGHAYRLDAAIGAAQVEQRNLRNRIDEHKAKAADIKERQAERQRQIQADEAEVEAMQSALAEAAAVRETVAADTAAQAALAAAEATLRDAEAAFNEATDRWRGNESELQVEANTVRHLEERLAALAEELGHLEATADGADSSALDAALREGDAAIEQDAQGIERKDAALAANATALTEARGAAVAADAALEAQREEMQALRERLGALDALQQAALGRDETDVAAWMAEQGLAQAPRLGEALVVTPGWERALETVLGSGLQAVRVSDVAALAPALEALQQGRVSLFEGREAEATAGELPTLAALAHTEAGPIGALLGGVFAADTLEEALAQRRHLRPGESIVTRDGVWLGPDWLRLDRGADASAGVIGRAEEIKRLHGAEEAALGRLAALSQAATAGKERVAELGAARERLQDERQGLAEQLAKRRAEQSARRVLAQEALARREQAQRQRALKDTATQEHDAAQLRVAAFTERRTALAADREAARRERDACQERATAARASAHQARERRHALELDRQGKASTLAAREAALTGLRVLGDDLEAQWQAEDQALAASRAALANAERRLQPTLGERQDIEAKKRQARTALEAAEAQLRPLTAKVSEAEGTAEAARQAVEDARIERKGAAVRRDDLAAQLRDAGADVGETLAALPEDASQAEWATKRERVERRISRLGAINLAAIEEYEAETERKGYQDAQIDDLERALHKLSTAMKKIDRETRERFKATFDEVNAHLNQLFPKVFGGGSAYLELTGDDLLVAGVSLMARPPGKRNSNVHMLSGGEKALTAVALIFAIFQLNPSPVCLLDEVDAPLDDANVGRFAELLEGMSGEVQFVVITHNKLTMQMADHLLGVTMNEPGVSRLVAVDMEEAAALAAV